MKPKPANAEPPSAKEAFFVLIADDSEADRLLFKTAIAGVPGLQIVAEVADGMEVIAYLRGLGRFRNRQECPLPDLLLLDLKMQFKDGFEVLEWLQTQTFDRLTVVVLTDSMQPEHIKRALDLGADHFHVKGRSQQDRHAMILALEELLLKRSAGNKAAFAA